MYMIHMHAKWPACAQQLHVTQSHATSGHDQRRQRLGAIGFGLLGRGGGCVGSRALHGDPACGQDQSLHALRWQFLHAKTRMVVR